MRCYLITFIKIYVVYIFVYIYIRARIGICICVYIYICVFCICTCTGGPDLHSLQYNMFFSLRLRLRLRTKSYNCRSLSRSGPKQEISFIHPSVRTHNHLTLPSLPKPPYGRRVYNIVHVQSTAKMLSGVRRSWTVFKLSELLYLWVSLNFL